MTTAMQHHDQNFSGSLYKMSLHSNNGIGRGHSSGNGTTRRSITLLAFILSATWIFAVFKISSFDSKGGDAEISRMDNVFIQPGTRGLSHGALECNSATLKKDASPVRSSAIGKRIQRQHQSQEKRQQYNFTAAICLITSDGEAYFQEWVDYHLMVMKFDAIYVYDNSDKYDLHRWFENTRTHPVYSKVEITHKPGPGYDARKHKHLQSTVYEDCIQRYGKDKNGPKRDYFALIDVDEFLVPQQEKYDSIHSVLEEYLVPFGGALVSNWVLFGSANRTVYSAAPVTKRFQYRDVDVHNVIKSIVKATDYRSQRNPHAVMLIAPDKNLVHTSEYPGAVQPNLFNMKDRTKASSWVKASGVLLVYHYRYTSDKEYYYKRCVRDGLVGHWCDKSKKKIKSDPRTPDHVQSRPGELFDDTAWKLLTLNVPKYQIYDTPEWEDFF